MGDRAAMLVVLTLTVLLCAQAGAQLCSPDGDNLLKCVLNSPEELQNLPDNHSAIHVTFLRSDMIQLTSAVFPPRPNLHSLSLDITWIMAISAGTFSSLSNLKKLNFTVDNPTAGTAHLSTLINGMFSGLSNLQELRLAGIGLTNIESNALSDLTSLLLLDLNSNNLGNLETGIFAENNQLKTLTVAKNNLQNLQGGLLIGLTDLTLLDVSSNSISQLEAGCFADNLNLEEVNLESNELTDLGSGVFTPLQQLTVLRMNNNEIASIEDDTFVGQSNLETLDLNSNKLTSINKNAMQHLTSVIFLKMEDNQITDIHGENFNGMAEMTFLDLSHNNITTIHNFAFSGAPNLVNIHLEDNQLDDLKPKAFDSLQHVHVLTMYGNSLISLPSGIFDQMSSLAFLDLSRNKWRCDCDLAWLGPWLSGKLKASNPSSMFQLASQERTLCEEPATSQGTQLLTALSVNFYLDCFPTTAALTTIPTTEALITTTVEATTTAFLETTTAAGETNTTATTEGTTSYMNMETTNTIYENVTTGRNVTAVREQRGPLLKHSVLIAIVAACIAVAVLLVLLTVIGIYCRQRRLAFWEPRKPEERVDIHDPSRLVYYAKHKHPMFYMDPETGNLEVLDKRAFPKKSKVQYAFENPGLQTEEDTNANTLSDLGGGKLNHIDGAMATLNPDVVIVNEMPTGSMPSVGPDLKDPPPDQVCCESISSISTQPESHEDVHLIVDDDDKNTSEPTTLPDTQDNPPSEHLPPNTDTEQYQGLNSDSSNDSSRSSSSCDHVQEPVKYGGTWDLTQLNDPASEGDTTPDRTADSDSVKSDLPQHLSNITDNIPSAKFNSSDTSTAASPEDPIELHVLTPPVGTETPENQSETPASDADDNSISANTSTQETTLSELPPNSESQTLDTNEETPAKSDTPSDNQNEAEPHVSDSESSSDGHSSMENSSLPTQESGRDGEKHLNKAESAGTKLQTDSGVEDENGGHSNNGVYQPDIAAA